MYPIYSTNGEWVAMLHEGRLYDTLGEWIAWLDDKEVYNRDGQYVGFLSDEARGTCGRILRERIRRNKPLRHAPPGSPKIRPPSHAPLAPLFAELPWNVMDVFEDNADIFRYISELRPDWED